MDEYVSGAAPPEAHARAILEMCTRNNVQPAQCIWTGDNVHFGSGKNGSGKMSNSLLMRAFENILRMPQLPFRIRTIKKPRYSVYYGSAMIHSIMARKQFFIHPKCKKTIQSIQRWTMKKTQSERSRDPDGHCVDALRYCVTPVIENTTIHQHTKSFEVLNMFNDKPMKPLAPNAGEQADGTTADCAEE